VLFGVAFTGSGERAIHPTHQRASPAAARTSARQNSLRSHLCRKRSVHALMSLPQEQFDAQNSTRSQRRVDVSLTSMVAMSQRIIPLG
jgi:hypothetical protein